MEVPVYKILDSRIDNVPRSYIALQGPMNTIRNKLQATTHGKSQSVWYSTTPSTNVYMHRKLVVEHEFIVKFDNKSAIPATLDEIDLESFDSYIREFPLSSVTDVLQLQLNNHTVSVNLADTIHALVKTGTTAEERTRFLAGCPSKADEFPINIPNGGASSPFNVAGQNNRYQTQLADGHNWRQAGVAYAKDTNDVTNAFASYIDDTYVDPSGNVAYLKFKCYEPVMISPLHYEKEEVQGLLGVQNFRLQYNYGDLARMIVNTPNRNNTIWKFASITNTGKLDDCPLEAKNPLLHIMFLTPRADIPLPTVLRLPFYDVARYITSNSAPLPFADRSGPGFKKGGIVEVQSNNIILHSIPSKILIYLQRRANADFDRLMPSAFAGIERVNINWNAVSGVLSSYDQKDLHALSVKNGSRQSWPQFNQYQGSVLIINPAEDFPLYPLEANGSIGNYQLQLRVDAYNLVPIAGLGAGLNPEPSNSQMPAFNASNQTYDLYVLTVNEGFMKIDHSTITTEIGVLTEPIIAGAPWAPAGTHEDVKLWLGGGWWDKLKGAVGSIVRNVPSVVKYVANSAPKLAPLLAAVPEIGPELSMGVSQVGQVANALKGQGRRKGGEISGGEFSGGQLSGGRTMSRGGLARRR